MYFLSFFDPQYNPKAAAVLSLAVSPSYVVYVYGILYILYMIHPSKSSKKQPPWLHYSLK